MKFNQVVCVAVALFGSQIAACASDDPVELFNGRSLRGWKGSNAWWSVRDHAITGEIPAGQRLNHNQFIWCEKAELRDFILEFDYRIAGGPSANSGAQFRSQPHGEGAMGYQADLDDGATWLGRVYEEDKRGLLVERGSTVSISPEGKRFAQKWAEPESFRSVAVASNWNHYAIMAIGGRVELRVNGKLYSVLEDYETAKADRSGKLGLQLHSGPGPAVIQFRNIFLKAIEQASVSATNAKVEVADAPKNDDGVSPPGLNLDFEKGTIEGWTAVGDVFKNQPIEGDTVTPRKPSERSNHAGKFWIGTFEKRKSDDGDGSLQSAPFTVTQPWASFLVGGGNRIDERVDLIEWPSSNVVFTGRGHDREDMVRVTADLSKYVGKQIAIRIVDAGRGGWGHVNFDDFRFHKNRPVAHEPSGTSGRGAAGGSPIMQHLVPNPVAPQTNILDAMWVPPGFRVDLIAKEPDVMQPVAMAIDERGRLWVVEAYSYPQKRPSGLDRILIFEDKDGDGTFETRRVFKDGLNLVSGIEVGFGGVFVGAAPQLLFIPDRNHDDVPDGDAEVLLDGWGFGDTHETLNSFMWGADGWLYGNHGVFNSSNVGKPGAPDSERVSIHAGVWRYHPVTHKFEVFAHGGSNQWGLDYDEHGALFMTHCRSAWGRGPVTYVIRGGQYWNQSNGGHAPFISGGPAGFNPDESGAFRNFLLASARYGHGTGGAGKPGSDAIYGGHSHVGTMIYQGDNWPLQYRGQLYTFNLFGRQVNREVNVPDGSGYNTISAGAEMLGCTDQTFMGLDMQCGPDGAVFFNDWSDMQHCHHNQVAKWDRTNGRLYRMEWTATWKPRCVDLGKLSDKELIRELVNPNVWYARMARRLLQERVTQNTIVSSAIRRDLPKLATKDGPAANVLSYVWAAHVTGVLGDGEVKKLLASTNEHVRAWAVTLMTDSPSTNADAVKLRATFPDMAEKESSPIVRLALATTLSRLDSGEAWPLAEKLAARNEDATGRYIPAMIWYGIARFATADVARTMAMAEATSHSLLADSIAWFLSRDAASRALLAARLPDMAPARRARVMELMAFALDGRGIVQPPAGWEEIVVKLLKLSTPDIAKKIERLSAVFGNKAAIAKMRSLLADKAADTAMRKDALTFLDKANDTESLPSFIALLDEAAFRKQAIPLVGRFGDASVAARLIASLAKADAEERALILNTLSGRPVLARALLDEIRAGRTSKTVITSLQARQISNLGDASLAKELAAVWGKVNASTEDARKAAEKFKKLYNEAPKWSHELKDGEAVFAKTCMPCHSMNGKGGNLGPDLGGAWRNGSDYFIDNIVDPNAVVGEAYQLNVITLNDGTVAAGLVNDEGETLVVRAAAGVSQTVKKSDVKSRQVLEQSMMPPALLDTLQQKEVIDLIKYLTTEK